MNQPLVSVIVTTRNNHATLDACLSSVIAQSYAPIELLVVDNASTDDTTDIARRYTSLVYTRGPERSVQRNYGVSLAKGKYVAIIDSDMELNPDVILACVEVTQTHPGMNAVVIPEESFGDGFWAQCKRLERSYYVGMPWIEAARFFGKPQYERVGGYDESLISGEDWDLSRRIEQLGPIGRATEFIRHNEGHIDLWKTLRKKYYYAQHARAYLARQHVASKLTDRVGPLERYKLYFSRPRRLFKNPVLGLGLLFMKTCEYGFGFAGYLVGPKESEA